MRWKESRGRGEDWPAERGPELPLTPRNLLKPLSHTERNLGAVRGDCAGGVGADLHGLIIGEGHREQDPGIGQVPSERHEREVGGEASAP